MSLSVEERSAFTRGFLRRLRLVDPTERELDFKKRLLKYQWRMLLSLLLTGFIVWVTEKVNPAFFDYPYLQGTSIEKILKFWPLFLYAGVLTVLSCFSDKVQSSHRDEELFSLDVVTSIGAGLWEELGFRCLYLCTGMIMLAVMNWIFGTVFSLVIAGILILGGLGLLFGDPPKGKTKAYSRTLGILLVPFGCLLGYLFFTGADPLYWIYDWITVPIVNIVTLGMFADIFYGPYPKLFVFAMIAVNARFRNGHKYQGWYGTLNSWIIGFIMMHAMLTYGLWTAVVVHALYDAEIAVVQFFGKKVKG